MIKGIIIFVIGSLILNLIIQTIRKKQQKRVSNEKAPDYFATMAKLKQKYKKIKKG